MSEDTIKKEVLENGLTILSEEIPHLRSVSLGIWLKKGSRDESPEDAGMYHFIEHMLFKGTKTRSTYEIAQIMDSIGGINDAFTSKENTCFYAKTLDEHLPVILEIFADILIRPKFDREDIERERKVIHEEIKMVEDTPSDLVHEIFLESYWSGHPLGRPILGTTESVNAINRDRLLKRFSQNYVPHNMVVSAAGNIKHEELVKAVCDYFGPLKTSNGAVDLPYSDVKPKPMVLLRSKKDLEQAHICIGAMAYHDDHPDRYAASVLNVILGGSMSSRLFQKIREEKALCYTVYSSLSSFKDTGFANVYAATGKKEVKTAIELILQECRLLGEKPVGAEELENAKNHLKGSTILSLESSSNRMFSIARNDMCHGRQISVEEMMQSITNVTLEDVQRVARHLFTHKDYGIVVVGDLDDLNLKLDNVL